MINFSKWSELIHSKEYEWYCILKCHQILRLIGYTEFITALHEVHKWGDVELMKLDKIYCELNSHIDK